MNVLFITLIHIDDVNKGFVYTDLMRKFRDEGHSVYVISSSERKLGVETSVHESDGVKILNVKTLNITKTNIVEKGLGTISLEYLFIKAAKKYFKDIKFDLVLYSTPPITLAKIVGFIKKKNPTAISYLMLKDIFPQNAVDIEMFGQGSVFYKYFRRKEKHLYKITDYIGCMSPANVEYVVKHNPDYPAKNVEVLANSIELKDNVEKDIALKKEKRQFIREKYGLPVDKPVFLYGGNLGKPQGIDYIIGCLEANKNRNDCYFVVVGSGTEYDKVESWYKQANAKSVSLMKGLPKEDYDLLAQSCDVGLIFLDHRFTIPNYPSRLLSYMLAKMPVICATDVNTDIGRIAEQNRYGYWCESVKTEEFTMLVDKMLSSDISEMGQRGFGFMKANYCVDQSYDTIMSHI